ncbi:MAG: LysM peptidoglycan-binding domain-containing protein [Dehalococcoidia bacterium]
MYRWLVPALILLSTVATLAVACGSGGGAGPVDVTNVPTATPPEQLPDPLIVNQSDAPPGGNDTTYIVASGDSPGSIADQFGISVDDLMAANGITDPQSLQVGVELTIPGATSPPDSDVLGDEEEPAPTAVVVVDEPEPEPTVAEEPEPPAEGQVYIVQEGDIPETIAAQFGITAEELMAANGITDPTALQVGDELVIPAPSG